MTSSGREGDLIPAVSSPAVPMLGDSDAPEHRPEPLTDQDPGDETACRCVRHGWHPDCPRHGRVGPYRL